MSDPTSAEIEMADEFEPRVRAWLRQAVQPTSAELASLESFAASQPARRRLARPSGLAGWQMHGWRAIATVFAAVAAVGALVVGPALLTTPEPTPSPTATASPSPTPSATPTPTPNLPDSSIWANDPRLVDCKGPTPPYPGVSFLTAFEFSHASDYRTRLPGLGFIPELESSDRVLVVVYAGDSPSYEGSVPEVPAPRTHTPNAGTYDICVARSKDRSSNYLNVAIDWAFLAGTATPAPGGASAHIAAKLTLWAYHQISLPTWDPSRHLLWYVDTACRESAALYSWDPATGKSQHWAIPTTKSGPCVGTQVRVDASGAVWTLDYEYLNRLDPETKRVKSVRIASSTPTFVPLAYRGTAGGQRPDPFAIFSAPPEYNPTTLAVDGSSVLVARWDVAALTRFDENMKATTIPIPSDLSGASDLAVWDGHIYLETADASGQTTLAILGMDGSFQAWGTATGSLDVRPDGRVVAWQGSGKGVVLGPAGEAVEQVTAPLPSNVNSPFATDWQGRSWYVDWYYDQVDVRNILVEVDAT
jgi:hypothetical protein